MKTIRILKKPSYVLAVTALRKSFFLLMKPMDTIVLVIVVPTFAPMMIGTALSIVMAPEATSATTMAVVVELLCMMAVINSPINKAVNGLEVASMIVSAADLPKCCRDDTIRSNAKMNKTRVPKMYKAFRTLLHGCGAEVGCMRESGSKSGIKSKIQEECYRLPSLTII